MCKSCGYCGFKYICVYNDDIGLMVISLVEGGKGCGKGGSFEGMRRYDYRGC